MIKIPAELVGVLIGYAIVGVSFLLLAYLTTSFIVWNPYPAEWTSHVRGLAMSLVAFLFIARWAARNITVSKE